MIQFVAHEESLLTATIEWWGDGYFVNVFYPNGDPMPESCNDFMTMGDALSVIAYMMDMLHASWSQHDFPGEEESDIDWGPDPLDYGGEA